MENFSTQMKCFTKKKETMRLEFTGQNKTKSIYVTKDLKTLYNTGVINNTFGDYNITLRYIYNKTYYLYVPILLCCLNTLLNVSNSFLYR